MLPPFSLAHRVLAKVNKDKTEAVIVVPDWSAQYWYPQLMQMADHEPLYFWPFSKKSDSSTQTLREPSITSKIEANGNQSNTVIILEASLRQPVHCKYIKYWLAFSKPVGKIELTHVLDFLSAMFDKNMLIQSLIV